MEFVLENPKALITAAVGIAMWLIKTYVISFPPEVEVWVNVILTGIFVGLIGRFTRITKSEAKVLETVATKKEVAKIELEDKNQL